MNDRARAPRAGPRIVSALATVALVAVFWLSWKNIVEPRFFPKRFGVVIEGELYRSGRIDPSLLPTVIMKHGIDVVVSLTHATARGDQVLVQCAAGSERTGGVVYLYRTLILGESPAAAYAELLRFGHRPARNPELEAFLNTKMAYFAAEFAAHGIVRPDSAPLPYLPEIAHD